MNLSRLTFWKKPQPIEIPIPPEHNRRVMELVRDYERAVSGARVWEHYLLWEAIQELIPETADGSWRISIRNPMRLSVIKNA